MKKIRARISTRSPLAGASARRVRHRWSVRSTPIAIAVEQRALAASAAVRQTRPEGSGRVRIERSDGCRCLIAIAVELPTAPPPVA